MTFIAPALEHAGSLRSLHDGHAIVSTPGGKLLFHRCFRNVNNSKYTSQTSTFSLHPPKEGVIADAKPRRQVLANYPAKTFGDIEFPTNTSNRLRLSLTGSRSKGRGCFPMRSKGRGGEARLGDVGDDDAAVPVSLKREALPALWHANLTQALRHNVGDKIARFGSSLKCHCRAVH